MQIELLIALGRNKARRRSLHGLGHSERISVVILVPLPKRLRICRRNLSHIVAKRRKLPCNVMPDNFVEIHRALIISLAARNNVPAVYQTPVIAKDGGLPSYGADFRVLDRLVRSRMTDCDIRAACRPVVLSASMHVVLESEAHGQTGTRGNLQDRCWQAR